MIIGSGDIAKALMDREDAIIFASGVSDSKCRNQNGEFGREYDALSETYCTTTKPIIYFSSIALGLPHEFNRYYEHKMHMEMLVRNNCPDHLIIRLGNIDWGNNPNTFLNYIRDKKDKHAPVEIFDEYRYLVSKETLNYFIQSADLKGGHTIILFDKVGKVKDLII
jgi:UDP-2-acetamido-2,6-beta-L-arabino-hexul-4-ose reductase